MDPVDRGLYKTPPLHDKGLAFNTNERLNGCSRGENGTRYERMPKMFDRIDERLGREQDLAGKQRSGNNIIRFFEQILEYTGL
jgi:hypothetical protein